MPVSTKTHGVADYATAGTLLAAPFLLRGSDARGKLALSVAGGGVLATSLFTDYELGLRRLIPMKAHLALDAATGAALLASPWLLRTRSSGLGSWLPHVIFGASEIAAAALTDRTPGDRSDEPKIGRDAPMPGAASGVHAPVAAAEPRAGLSPRIATPPIETPGPSVTAPALPESETERREWAEARTTDMEYLAATSATDPVVAEEEAAAAAEAALVGGVVPHDADDPAMDPVYQAGGGDQDGWEAAEADLVENATHGDGEGNPLRDAFHPEAESDLSGAEYAEGNRMPSTEIVDDPDVEGDDPGAGPNLHSERT